VSVSAARVEADFRMVSLVGRASVILFELLDDADVAEVAVVDVVVEVVIEGD